ncbi:MAG: 50S ribosomal protein L18 [Parcubacteria group bacterium GW2011_GWC2_38_7]|nr:MAG: 50S ribosomal protein L18 [Parcubacteria group bacterium GW2011_GWC2_38_7]
MPQKEQQRRRLNFTLRKQRTRKQIIGKTAQPRLSVFRSIKHFYLQIIDDKKGVTLCSASDKDVSGKGKKGIEIATAVGTELAKRAIDKKVTQVVFDRGSYQYHGRVKAAAEAARAGGLKF